MNGRAEVAETIKTRAEEVASGCQPMSGIGPSWVYCRVEVQGRGCYGGRGNDHQGITMPTLVGEEFRGLV